MLALLIASILVLKLGRLKYSYLYIILIALAGLVTTKYIWLPFSIQAGMTASVYVYIGYKLKEHGKDIFTGYLIIKGFLVILWLFCICSVQGLAMYENDFGLGLVSFLGSIGGAYMILLISRIIDKRCDKLKRVLSFLGRHSLIIFCVHTIENYRFPWNVVFDILRNYPLPKILVFFVVCAVKIGISCVAIWIVRKSKVLRFVFSVR